MKTVKLGSIGLGKLGYLHAKNIALGIRNAELFAVCDQSEDALHRAKTELGVKHTYTSYDEMLENKELDGIVIVSPSAFHFDHIKKAVNKNLPIFCEKPLGLNLEEVYQINDYLTQSKYDKPFMLGFMRRFDPSYAEAKKMIDNGEIGKPYMIRCYGLDPIKWVKTAVPFAKHSGGIFLDMAVHDIDLARWFMDSEVSTIYASGQCYIEKGFEEHGDVDNGTALMNFDNGGMALFLYKSYLSSWLPHRN